VSIFICQIKDLFDANGQTTLICQQKFTASKFMKRRNFVKQSVAGAIISATPLALTGLVRADGGGGITTTTNESTDYGNSTDWWGNTESTVVWESTVMWQTTSYYSDETEISNYQPCWETGNVYKDFKDEKLVCWHEVEGCEEKKTGRIETCPVITASSSQADWDRYMLCDSLELEIMPGLCSSFHQFPY
jgi:hypothetical protein